MKSILSVGRHRDQSIVQLVAVHGLESSRFLVRLNPPAGVGVEAHQMGRQTCN